MIRNNFKQTVGISGVATLVKKNGEKVVQKNTITNNGLSEIVYSLLDKSLPQFYIAVGDDDSNITPPEIALQNALKNEIAIGGRLIHSNLRETTLDTDLNYVYNVSTNFGGSATSEIVQDPAVTLREIGLFNRYTGGNMFARAQTSAPFLMDTKSIFTGSWAIKFAIQDFISNGGIVRTGGLVLGNSISKYDVEIDNENQYYRSQNNDIIITPHPWGINLISLGTNAVGGDIEMTDLNAPQTDYDTPPTITRLDLTNEGSDPDYEAKIIIQKYIPPNTVPFIVTEAGLFNSRSRRTIADSANRTIIRTMFSRVLLSTPIPANAEAVLTWTIGFKRGA